MSPIYRPSQFSSESLSGDTSPASGTHELGGAGLTANAETQGWTQTDIRSAHQFFHPNVDTSSVAGHAAIAQPMPGADQAVLAAAGANEPFSPLIQLFMRMPGQIGLLSSLFEAIESWLAPYLEMIPQIDLFNLAQQAQASIESFHHVSLEHTTIDLALLPNDAPIFQTLDDGNGILHNQGLIDGRTDLSFAHSSETLGPLKDPLKVSGEFPLKKPQYENWGHMESSASSNSAANQATSLSKGSLPSDPASHHGWFTDQLTASHSPTSAGSSSTSAGTHTSPSLSASPSTSSLNVGASPFDQQADVLPAVAHLKEGLGASQANGLSPSFSSQAPSLDSPLKLGPSGAVSDQLGGKHITASSDDISTFRPTLGGMENYDSSSLGSDYATSSTNTSHSLHGLKAKALKLDGSKHSQSTHAKLGHGPSNYETAGTYTQQHRPVIDHIGYQTHGGTHHAGYHSASGYHQSGQVVDQIAHQSKGTVRGASHGANGPVYDQIAHRQPFSYSHYFKPKTMAEFAPPTQGQTTYIPADQTSTAMRSSTSDMRFVTEHQPESDIPASYTIRAGDCLWNISHDHLGSPLRWPEIYRTNSDILGSNPNLIHPGVTIKLPSIGSELTSASKYIVKSGDNLWNLSQHFTGHGERWGELYRMNVDVIGSNPRLIFPGQELTIPGLADPTQAVAEAGDAASGGLASANVGTASGTAQQLVSGTNNQLAQGATHTQHTLDYTSPSSFDTQSQVSQSDGSTATRSGDSTAEAQREPVSGPGAAQAATPSNQAPAPTTTQNAGTSQAASKSPFDSSSLLPDLTSFLRRK